MWKRTPLPILILLAAVAILLPLLAFLQYRWLGQVSTAERERMRSVLRSAASQFGETFDAEITRAYSTFQYPQARMMSDLGADFARRVQKWDANAADPQIVRELFVIEADDAGSIQWMRFNKATQHFDPVEWPNEFKTVPEQSLRTVSDYIHEEPLALIIPPEDAVQPERAAQPQQVAGILCTIVLLDPDYLKRVFIPALAGRYFAGKEELQYDLTIVSQGKPQNIIFQTSPDLAPVNAASDAVTGLFDVRLETLRGKAGAHDGSNTRRSPDAAGLIRVVKPQRSRVDDEQMPGRWRLIVRHHAGSLEEAVANGRRRNLAISFGVLLLLAVSVGFIVSSSRRATNLANEQIKFVAGVSHELRTPLAVICSAGENLADGVVAERRQVAEYGDLIRNEGRRLSQMVEQVLEYAGAQSGRKAYRLHPTDVREIMDAALRGCPQLLENGGFNIETKLEANLPRVNADAAALQRALQNLLSNAIKFAGENPVIEFSARRETAATGAEEVQITVADHGRGIARTDLPHIFEPFFRGRDVVAAQIEGSGLGLNIVQHIVAAHGGGISVESTPGEGSSFTVHLPAHS